MRKVIIVVFTLMAIFCLSVECIEYAHAQDICYCECPCPDAGADSDTDIDTDADTDTDSDTDVDTETDTEEPEIVLSRYPANDLHSPITYSVAQRLRGIVESAPDGQNGLAQFGDSISVGKTVLSCYNTFDYEIAYSWETSTRLESYFDPEDSFINFFLDQNIDPAESDQTAAHRMTSYTTPLDREPIATRVSHTCNALLPYLQPELDDANPAFMIAMCGANNASSTQSAGIVTDRFIEEILQMIDTTLAHNTIPILRSTPTQIKDDPRPGNLATMNVMLRAVAQSYQIPYANLHDEFLDITMENYGLSSDGVHLNSPGYLRVCHFNEENLVYGKNQQNLIIGQQLDRAVAVTFGGTSHLDPEPIGYIGSGTENDPVVVDEIPFVHHGDISAPVYYSMDATSDVRIVVVDEPGADVDIRIGGNTYDNQYDGAPANFSIDPVSTGRYWLTVQ